MTSTDGSALPRAPASTRGTRYRVRLVRRVADIPEADWSSVRAIESSLLMDRRFLGTVERAFPDARCYHAIVYDQRDQACAWASLCAFPVDLATLAGAAARSAVARVRAVRPEFARVCTLFVGLPVSLGQSHLVIDPDADAAAVLSALDDACMGVAECERASLVVWKEFDPGTAARLASLRDRGYFRAETPPMHELDAGFPSFDAYCAALTAHYRADIRRSERKFRASGLQVLQLQDAAAIARIYTPQAHRLYESVVDRASVKLEMLPIEFFQTLVEEFAGLVTLTVIADGDRVVAFNWGLLDGRVYHYLFCGIDYAVARDTDLYFNLMYHQLDAALRLRPDRVEMGQTADVFKARLGCRAVPRYVYVKACRAWTRAALRWGASLLFPSRPSVPSRAVFKAPGTAAGTPRYDRASS